MNVINDFLHCYMDGCPNFFTYAELIDIYVQSTIITPEYPIRHVGKKGLLDFMSYAYFSRCMYSKILSHTIKKCSYDTYFINVRCLQRVRSSEHFDNCHFAIVTDKITLQIINGLITILIHNLNIHGEHYPDDELLKLIEKNIPEEYM